MKLLQPKTTEIADIEKMPKKTIVPASGGSWIL